MFGGKGRFSSGPSTPPKPVRDHRDRPKKNWRELRLGDHPLKNNKNNRSRDGSTRMSRSTNNSSAVVDDADVDDDDDDDVDGDDDDEEARGRPEKKFARASAC